MPIIPRKTEIITEVIGYQATSRWGTSVEKDVEEMGTLPIRVAITGRGPNGKLSGTVTINPVKDHRSRITHSGTGRYSFMHGNASLHSGPIMDQIDQLALAAAEAWVKANPGALNKTRLDYAKWRRDRAENDLKQAQDTVVSRQQTFNTASDEYVALHEKLVGGVDAKN